MHKYNTGMNYKYKYNGIGEVVIGGIAGAIHESDTFECEFEINNPDFELISSTTDEDFSSNDTILQAPEEELMEE